MDLFESITKMHDQDKWFDPDVVIWKETAYSNFVYDEEMHNELIQFIVSNIGVGEAQSLFECESPEIQSQCMKVFIAVCRSEIRVCAAKLNEKTFIGTVDKECCHAIGNLIKLLTDFLNSSGNVEEVQCNKDEELPKEFYSDFRESDKDNKIFRLNTANAYSSILAFPSLDNGVWFCIVLNDEQKGLLRMASKLTYSHFLQTVNVFLPRILSL